MIRSFVGDQPYWDEWKAYRYKRMLDEAARISQPSENPAYRPQYVLNNARHIQRYILTLYSQGSPIRELKPHFPGVLDAWALSNRLSEEICAEHKLETCRDWDFALTNLNHYNWCFWLVGLALTLETPDESWRRLLSLIGGEGEDELLDRVIASRSPERRIGTALLHPQPYARLLKAVDAPKPQQATLLRDFVHHWYQELKRPPPKDRRAPTIEPYWYIYGDPVKNPLEAGSYFGRWCIEAAAAVKAFGLDDSLCLGHEHYPGDLLRPNGPTTHPRPMEPKRGFLARLLGRK